MKYREGGMDVISLAIALESRNIFLYVTELQHLELELSTVISQPILKRTLLQ